MNSSQLRFTIQLLMLSAIFARPLAGATITYFDDSDLGFDVLIEDTGAIGISPMILTPSGFWSFNYQVESVDGFPNVAEIHALVRREMPAVGDFINPLFGAPTFKAFDELPAMGSDTVDGDTINGVFTRESGVALDDWEWNIRLTRVGDVTSVPDAASTASLFGLAGLGLLAARRFRKARR